MPHFNHDNYQNSCRDWGCFHEKFKDIFEEARIRILVDEQKHQCGYTEIYINDSKDSHIDHYVKRSHNPHRVFDWSNLIVATKDDDFGANYKDNEYSIGVDEYSTILNPIVDEVENFFYYSQWGEIREDEGKVKNSVNVFNLNHQYLKQRRAALITLINNYNNSGLSIDDIKNALVGYGFRSVVEQYCTEAVS